MIGFFNTSQFEMNDNIFFSIDLGLIVLES